MEQPIGTLNQKKCPRCGLLLNKNDTICPDCGKKLNLEVPERPTQLVRTFDN